MLVSIWAGDGGRIQDLWWRPWNILSLPGGCVMERGRLSTATLWRIWRWSLGEEKVARLLWSWVQLRILLWREDMAWLAYTGEREVVWYFMMLVNLFCLETMLREGRIRRIYYGWQWV